MHSKKQKKVKGMPVANIAKTIKGKGVSLWKTRLDGMEKLQMTSSTKQAMEELRESR